MTYLLQRNDKFVTVHNKGGKIPPSTSVHLATHVRISRTDRPILSSTYLYSGSSIKNFVSSVHLSFSNVTFYPNPQTKI
jgi:hypothetical protein